MKIEKITKIESEIIRTDDTSYPTYRRNSKNDWENLMNDSWETAAYPDELESLYQEYKKGL